MHRSYPDTVRSLKRRLEVGLPGREAQMRMAPVYAEALERSQVDDRSCREAGVLIVLLPVHNTPQVVVTVRRRDLRDHAGQVSFPGGRREDGESLLQTALRETKEEIDLPAEEIDVIGALTPLFIYPSNYCVYPFLGYTAHRPSLEPHDYEVDRIVEIPLPLLLEESTIRRERRTIRGEQIEVPYFDVAGLKIWGATAMMLSELVALAEGIH